MEFAVDLYNYILIYVLRLCILWQFRRVLALTFGSMGILHAQESKESQSQAT